MWSPPTARVRPSGLYARLPRPESVQRQRVPDLRVGPGIEEEDPAAASLHGQRLPVGTDRDSPEHVAVTVHDPDGSGVAPERREQVAAGLRRVVDRDRLAGEQEREVEVLLDERLGAEALDELGRLRVARLTALDERRRSRRRRPPPARPRPRRAGRAGGGWCA